MKRPDTSLTANAAYIEWEIHELHSAIRELDDEQRVFSG